MPIWYLEARKGADLTRWASERGSHYFEGVHCRGFIIVAPNEKEARRLACKTERAGLSGSACERWLDADVTTCVLVTDDRTRVIMANWPD